MFCGATGAGRAVRSGPLRWWASRLPELLAVLAILVAANVPSTLGDCPAVHPNCYCRHDNIYCHDLGDIPQVPAFRPSGDIYHKLVIENGTTISTVQAGAFEGVKVKRIVLSRLGVKTIESGAFSHLGDVLEKLDLSFNQIETVPDDVFVGLVRLKRLSLYTNKLRTLTPTVFRDLIELKELVLGVNRLPTLSPSVFRHLAKLEVLVLVTNKLETITDDAFVGLQSLRNLHLANNNMTTVGPNAFNHLAQLESLYIQYNRIETLPDGVFDRLFHLKTLAINNNRLTTIKAALLKDVSNVDELSLEDNPWLCDCALAWLRNKRHIFRDNPRCASPSALKGTPVSSFDISMCKYF